MAAVLLQSHDKTSMQGKMHGESGE